jgi:dTDP-4-amino-4,6-dideoxygalactose transaminase
MGMKFGARECPVTENVSSRLLRLPFYNDLTDDEQGEIVAAITDFFGQKRVYTPGA